MWTWRQAVDQTSSTMHRYLRNPRAINWSEGTEGYVGLGAQQLSPSLDHLYIFSKNHQSLISLWITSSL